MKLARTRLLQGKGLESEYIVRRTGDPGEAEILQSGQLVAHLDRMKNDSLEFLKVEDGSNRVFKLDPRVDGVILPFSSAVYNDDESKPILKIRSGVFSYNGKVYLFKSLPEGKSMKGHLNGEKYITRLDNFPYRDVDEIDRLTRENLTRHRGVEVGKLSGLGRLEHRVILSEELSPVALPLAAVSYLLYSTG